LETTSKGVWKPRIFARTVAEGLFAGGELLLRDEAEVGALGEVLADQAIGVLVGATPPGAVACEPVQGIIRLAGQRPHRWCPLSSNG
jgi:hypothetical protein